MNRQRRLPHLHHLPAFRQMGRPIVCTPERIADLVRKLMFNEVGPDTDHLSATALEFGHGLLECDIFHVPEHESHALVGERLRDAFADPARSASDDGHSTAEIFHR